MFDIEDKKKRRDWWGIGQVLVNAIGAVAIPLIIFFAGSMISTSLRDREAQTKLIEISINILKTKPGNEEDKAIRMWALEVLDRFSEVKMSQEQKAILSSKPIIRESTSVYMEVTSVCPNMPAAVVVEDPARLPSERDVNLAQYEKMFFDEEICYVGPVEQSTAKVENIVRNIKEAIDQEHLIDTESISFGDVYVYKPCKSYHFYVQEVAYAGIVGTESHGTFGRKCIVEITLD